MSKQIKYIIIASIVIFGIAVVIIILTSNAKKKREEEEEQQQQEEEEYNHENPEATNCTAMGDDCIPYTEDMKKQDTKAIQAGCAGWFLVPFLTFMYWDCTRDGKNSLPIVGLTCVHLNKKHTVRANNVKYDVYKPC